MKLGIASIQKNESKWVVEWLSWYLVQGFDKFIIYNHMSEDNTREIYDQLSRHYDITIHDVEGWNVSYPMMQHYLDTYRPECDWISYNDTDEFMLPLEPGKTVRDILWDRWDIPNSAIGIYWTYYGSNGNNQRGDYPGHRDPEMVTQAYTRRGRLNHVLHHHMKSIVRGRGRGGKITATNPHVYTTEFGTVDLLGRPIMPHQGWNKEGTPCHEVMRINHYWCKSMEWFTRIKQPRGYRFDRPPTDPSQEVQLESWWRQNLNEEEDLTLKNNWSEQLLAKIDEVKSHLTIEPNMYSRLTR